MDSLFLDFLAYSHSINPWIILGIHAVFCGLIIRSLMRLWGLLGLYIYGALATIASNIAVLKVVHFPIYERPIALGTVLFMSVFLCSDLINEFFGKKEALRLIWVGFISYFIFSIFLYIIISYPPVNENLKIQESLKVLFIPAPAIFLASLGAYFTSQYVDVIVYNVLHKWTGAQYLWLRAFVSTFLGALIDNTVFSIFLWYVLMPNPKGFQEIWWTYIVGIFLLRVVLSFANIGFMYGIKRTFPKTRILS